LKRLNHHQLTMKKLNILFFFFFSISPFVLAQTNYQQEYLKAKAFFNEGSYNLAMEAFKPVIKKDKENYFSEYSSYFYAISAYRNGFSALSRDMFLQIKTLFPKWDKIEDVHIWLAKIYFEDNDFHNGLKYSNGVVIGYELSKLQQTYYLSKIDSLELISELFNTYKNDKEVAYRYAQLINEQPLYLQDRSLLAFLVEGFNLDNDEFSIVTKEESIKKDNYNVAVMLPFMVNKLQPNLYKKGNQFVIDIYEGIVKAQHDLKDNGIDINLYAYDTEKNSYATSNILIQPEFHGMDLIIGPLYSDPSREVSMYSHKNKVNMFNPISSNQEVIGENPFSFLYHPSDATQAKAAAQYVIENKTNKNTMIFYGGSKKDSIKAHTFRQLIEKDSFNIVFMEKIVKDTSSHILKLLTTTLEDIEETLEEELTEEERGIFILAPDSIGTIYVASDNKLLASGVVSSIEIRPDTIQVIGSTEWLKYRFIDFEAYERLGIVLTSANYIDTYDYTSRQLSHYTIARFGKPASTNFLKAYDMMMFLGNSLNEYGTLFQNELYNKPMSPSELTSGISFFKANDNQHVPLVYFKNNKIVKIELDNDNE
ncbi:MAG: ABC transporter substrate-binding protein, partial [Cyclobacteriaceae bacterium]|nr:ABC transporter substrate-binding protein [Cyclobacteriaceae bacterium]